MEKAKWIMAYLVTAGIILTGLQYLKTERVEEVLRFETQDALKHYTVMYAFMKEMSQTIRAGVVSHPDFETLYVRAGSPDAGIAAQARAQLYEMFEDEYAELSRHHVKQLHFHLPDNRSFLRMHSPELFGDDLTDVRTSVRICNRDRRFVEGFEQGRIIHGFRFVFPVTGSGGTHLGSFEVSYTAQVFIEAFQKTFGLHMHFIEKAETVNRKSFEAYREHYRASAEHPAFLTNVNMVDADRHAQPESYDTTFKRLSKSIEEGIESAVPFSVHGMLDRREHTITFLPLRDLGTRQVVAYMVIYKPSDYIASLESNYMAYTVFALLVTLLLFVAYYRVITHKERLARYNRRLAGEVERLVDAEKEKQLLMLRQNRLAQMGELLSMIAHQWRQPLSAITTVASRMRLNRELGKLDDGVFDEQVGKIEALVVHMSQTITKFREFYQPKSDAESANLDTLVQHTLEIIESQLERNGIAVVLELNIETPMLCFGNEIEQVFLNLIQNARDELVERGVRGPRITIASRESAEGYSIAVMDNAGGIAPELTEKIFDPYFTTKGAKNGTGLGLYMSKMIVEEHCGGTLSVRNDKEGAVFTVTLPKKRAK